MLFNTSISWALCKVSDSTPFVILSCVSDAENSIVKEPEFVSHSILDFQSVSKNQNFKYSQNFQNLGQD